MNTIISEPAGATQRKLTQQSCKRCSGYMVHEMCIDLENDSGYCTCWVLRCLQCGDLVDEAILRNRSVFNPETVRPQLEAAA